MREFTFQRCVLLVVLLTAPWSAVDDKPLVAQTVGDAAPLSGDALQRKLAEQVGVSWSGVPLGEVAASLARNTRVCIWLDRRVDRGRRVDWSSSGRSLRETIAQLAATQNLGITWIGSVAYVAPKAAAAGLPTLIGRRNNEIAALPPSLRTSLTERGPIVWDDLAEPRVAAHQLAAQAGWTIENETLVPHDLWSKLETPPLTFNERLSLLTAGFELTYQLHPATKKIVLGPWPADLAVPANKATIPKPTASTSGTSKSANSPAGVPGRQVYTLRVTGVPLSKLIDVLKQKHNLNIRVDDQAIKAAGLTLDKATAVDVQQATLEALLEQAAAPLGLHARQDGDTVVIEPKK